MSSTHWIEAVVAFVLWVLIPLIFFNRDIMRWWATRDVRRIRAAQAAKEKADAETRYRDELAAKYRVPETPQRSPESTG